MATAPQPLHLGLRGRTAVVTGGSEGIGRAIALRLAAEGMNLHLAARTEARLDELRSEIVAGWGVRVGICALDLTSSDAQMALFAACRDADVLVNNAGAIPGGTLLTIGEAEWRHAWDLKVFGYINLARLYYSGMLARGRGTILNIIGNSGLNPRADNIAGGVANAALIAFTQALGGASIANGVRVVGINPGPTATRRVRVSPDVTGTSPEARAFHGLPAGRLGRPEEIADLAAFLISDLSAYTSGTVVTTDGGVSVAGSFFGKAP